MATIQEVQNLLSQQQLQHQTELASLSQQIAQLQSVMSSQQQQQAAATPVDPQLFGGQQFRGGPFSLTAFKSFDKVPRFSSRQEEYTNWRFRFRTFLAEVPKMAQFTRELERLPGELTEEQLAIWESQTNGADCRWCSQQLYALLSLNVEGTALTLVQALEDADHPDVRGGNAWLRILREFEGVTGQRLAGMVERIFSPKRCARYSETTQAIASWEIMVRDFCKGANTNFCDILMVHGIKKVVPAELEKDITRSTTLHTYDLVKNYILDQVNVRKEPHFQTNAPSSKATAMDLDHTALAQKENQEPEWGEEEGQEEGSAADGMFGLGGGKGSGRREFQGECYTCGKWGHQSRHCPLKQGGKGKGKGEKGNGKGDKGGAGKGQSGGGWNRGAQKGKGRGPYWIDEPAGGGASSYAASGFPTPGFNAWTGAAPQWSPGPQPTQWTVHALVEKFEKKIKACTPPPRTQNRYQVLADDAEEVQTPDMCIECGVEQPWQEVVPKQKARTQKPHIVSNVHTLLEQMKPPPAAVPPTVGGLNKSSCDYARIEEGWTHVRVIPDSGAIQSVAPKEMAVGYPIRPSAGSMRGQQYVSASGDEIPNEGEQFLPIMSAEGHQTTQRWQMAEVTRPLQSVGELCDQGHRVVFGRGGGYVVDVQTGNITAFARENGTYLMDMWIPPSAAAQQMVMQPQPQQQQQSQMMPGSATPGFTRQGK